MIIQSPLKSVQMLPVFLSFLLCLIGSRAQQQFFHLVGPSSVFGFNNVNGAGNLMECKRFFENITDVETLNHHEYVAFESCVFYHLANKAQQQTAASGLNFGASLHPISSLPPNFSEIKLLVTKITIQHFQLNEFVRDLNIVGYLELRWNDDRLSWDQQQFKVPQIRIASASHIWVPYLTGQGFETALRNEFEQMEVRKLEVRSGGNVTAILGFKFSTFCDDTDFKNFPDDVYRCCYYLEPLNQRPLVRLLTDGLPVFTDPKYFRDYGWALSGTVPTIFMDPANITQMNFCLNLQRASSTLKTELEIPAWACAFLLLSTPLFAIIASVRTQLFAKLFILLLQFLTLMLFTQRIAPQMGSSATTPTILEVHELGLVLNVISILFSFLVLALCKLRVYNQPPWDILLIASSLINKFVCIFDSAADYQDLENLELKKEGTETGSDATVSKSPNNRFRADWIGCFLAFHAVGTLVLSLCFLIGYLTIH